MAADSRRRRINCRPKRAASWKGLADRHCMLIYLPLNIPGTAGVWSSGRNCRTIFFVYASASVCRARRSDRKFILVLKGLTTPHGGHADVTWAIYLSPGLVL